MYTKLDTDFSFVNFRRSTANKNMMGAGLMYTIAEIRTLESNLTLQQIRDKEAKLRKGGNYAWAFEVLL